MAQIGNKKNAQLNGDWGKHTKEKKRTSSLRRLNGKEEICQIIKEEVQEGGSDALSARLISG
jgi:hypothetical protein